MSDIVPRNQVTRQGVVGVAALGGGVALLVLAGGGLFGIIAGGALVVAGLALMTGSKSDRTMGIVGVVVGAASLATGILGHAIPIITWLMRASGIVLLGTGIVSLFRFFNNLRKRS